MTEDKDKAKEFALAVGRLVTASDLEPPHMVFAFGVVAQSMVRALPMDAVSTLQVLVEAFMTGLGGIVMTKDEARDVLEATDDTPPRVLN